MYFQQGWPEIDPLAEMLDDSPVCPWAEAALSGLAGRDVYMDMNGWHLFLRDVNAGHGLKLNQALAQQVSHPYLRLLFFFRPVTTYAHVGWSNTCMHL